MGQKLQDEVSLPLAAEELTVGKRRVVRRKVRVSTLTRWRDEAVHADLDRDEVEIERVAVGRVVDSAPPIREEDGVTIVPLVAEELVLSRRLVLREEIHIRKKRTVTHFEDTVRLRHQEAVIERLDADAAATSIEKEQP